MTKPSLSNAFFCVAGLIAATPHALAQTTAPQSSTRNAARRIAQPPIAIRFTMPRAGYATLVIEDAQGKRVRNLLSEAPFAAGKNTIYWDGLDDLGRDPDAASHGIGRIPGHLVPPGRYTVRGLVRPEINLRYEMTPYTHGDPPWEAAARSAQWLANHTPPSAVLFVPAGQAPRREGLPSSSGGQIMAGSWVTEGGSGLAWLDTNGKKLNGQWWIGGAWTGATHLARDNGPNPVEGSYAYSGSAWDDELRLYGFSNQAGGNAPNDTRMGTGEERAVLEPRWQFPKGTRGLSDQGATQYQGLNGLAVYNGVLVASMPIIDSLLFVDARNHKVLGQAPMEDPRGLAFDNQGRLLVLSSTRLLRYALGATPQKLGDAQTLVSSGLEDPIGIALDASGNIYLSDRGNSHQVKVFDANGKFLRAIGHAGKPKAGPYDAGHMNNPNGVTIDDKGRLWVAETDFLPKRLSVWNTQTGALVDAFYGPSTYGGGGELDPRDRSLFSYNGMTFKLDWDTAQSRLIAVLARPESGMNMNVSLPQTTFYRDKRQYMTSVYSTNATQGNPIGALWMPQNGVAQPRSAFGRASDWPLIAGAFPRARSNFSVRWTGQIVAPQSGDYTFSTVADDGTRLWVNGRQLVDEWHGQGPVEHAGIVHLEAGTRADLNLEYYQGEGGASVQLFWQGPGTPRQIVPASALFPDAKASTPGGLTAHYFSDSKLGELIKTQIDTQVNFDWNNKAPAAFSLPPPPGVAARAPLLAPNGTAMFAWSDLNADGQLQADELQFAGAGENGVGGVTLMPDLSWLVQRVNGRTMRYAPVRFTPADVPVYDLNKGEVLSQGAQLPPSTGGEQALYDAQSGWTVLTTAPKPFSPYGFGGVKNGVPMWSYPSLWPGLHAGHDAPVQQPGQVIASTRLAGGLFRAPGSDAGPLWAINSDHGQIYVFTEDGMFVATLFKDAATASFNAPAAKRGMLVNHLSLQGENFFPMLSSTRQGIYVQGVVGTLFHVEGLEKVRRLPNQTLNLSRSQVQAAQAYFVQSEADRQAREAVNGHPLTIALRTVAPVVDGKLDDWKTENFVPIDVRRSSTGGWPPGHNDFQTEAALSISGDRLYAAFRTDDANLLRNRPEALQNLFKSGGALDLMLGNVAGGQRLLVTRSGEGQNAKTIAVLYRPRDPNAKGEPIKFTSMLGINKTTVIDLVQDVSDQVTLASDGGNFEYSIPLNVLMLKPQNGQSLKGDIGVLRGNGVTTLQRVYWRNKATGLVSDLASEAELTPQLWGTMEFKAQ